jgi:hypothetical protein
MVIIISADDVTASADLTTDANVILVTRCNLVRSSCCIIYFEPVLRLHDRHPGEQVERVDIPEEFEETQSQGIFGRPPPIFSRLQNIFEQHSRIHETEVNRMHGPSRLNNMLLSMLHMQDRSQSSNSRSQNSSRSAISMLAVGLHSFTDFND